jgi:hypothetical protein
LGARRARDHVSISKYRTTSGEPSAH